MDEEWEVHRRGWDAYDIVMDQVRPHGACLIFTGVVGANGYGKVDTVRGTELAHRVVAERHLGPPKGRIVCHSCDVPTCVNPQHMRYGTHADNGADKRNRGRATRGAAQWRAYLTEGQVRAIKRDKRPAKEVAETFGCTRHTVYNIRSGYTWAWLD